jgi:predicted transcriptional regulator YdeE
MPAEQSRLESFGPFRLTGILRSHRMQSDDETLSSAVAMQWRDLLCAAFKIPARLPPLGFGAGLHFEPGADALEFFCGFVLRSTAGVPEGLQCVVIPESTCAVFRHSGEISRLRYTLDAIFGTALSLAGLHRLDPAGDVPSFVLRSRISFDPLTGFGGVDVLVPLKV